MLTQKCDSLRFTSVPTCLQVAYLNFVKKLGFEQMFIWACPPMQVGGAFVPWALPLVGLRAAGMTVKAPVVSAGRERWS